MAVTCYKFLAKRFIQYGIKVKVSNLIRFFEYANSFNDFFKWVFVETYFNY